VNRISQPVSTGLPDEALAVALEQLELEARGSALMNREQRVPERFKRWASDPSGKRAEAGSLLEKEG